MPGFDQSVREVTRNTAPQPAQQVAGRDLPAQGPAAGGIGHDIGAMQVLPPANAENLAERFNLAFAKNAKSGQDEEAGKDEKQQEQAAASSLTEEEQNELNIFIIQGFVPTLPNAIELVGDEELDTAAITELFLSRRSTQAALSQNPSEKEKGPHPMYSLFPEAGRGTPYFEEFRKNAVVPLYTAQDKGADTEFLSIRHWPLLLPHAERSAAERIQVVKGKTEVLIPALKKSPELSAEQEERINRFLKGKDKSALPAMQKSLLEKIAANRSKLPQNPPELVAYGYGGNNKAGYYFSDPQKKGDPKPALPKGTVSTRGKDAERRTQVNQVIWREMSGEGGAAAINTYDEQILTWGKGFGAADGVLRSVMRHIPPEVRKELLSVGITYQDDKWLMVNIKDNVVEEEKNALRLLQFDKPLLGLLIDLSRRYQEGMVEAQWKALAETAARYPDDILAWPDSAIALAAHCIHWRSTGWSPYVATKGDLRGILRVIGGKVGKLDPARGNATFVGQDATRILASFGGGTGRAALNALSSGPLPGNINSGSYSGTIFFKRDDKNYYRLPPA